MNVVSLFDGMSCGQIALKNLGITVDNYFASEIDTYAIKVAKKNHPNMVHLPSVEFVTANMLSAHKIDLLIGGSPCQSFSTVGDGSGFDGKSKLFWEFVRVLKELRAKNKDMKFLLENVKMKKEWANVITEALGVEPIEINSAHFTSHNRTRLYWTNIKVDALPEKNEMNVGDLLMQVDGAKWMKRGEWPNFLNNNWGNVTRLSKLKSVKEKGHCLTATMYKGQISTFVRLDEGYETLVHKLTPRQCEHAQGVDLDYTSVVSNTQRYKMLGNGWNVPTIEHIFQGL